MNGGTHNGADHHEEKNDSDFVDDDFGDDVSSPAPIMKSMNQNQVMEMVSHFNQTAMINY